ncbi:MAG: N-acetylglucosamine-6-phosphate deacetylase [Eubacteriales bacterium]|nr:N-acetylglucosamine-6-phosphate deacetylase [Eubacteriales bacterium]
MKAIINGRVLIDGQFTQGQALLFKERIVGLSGIVPEGVERIDANGGVVAPGLIDVHCHGFGGREAGETNAQELAAMSCQLVSHGVTAWLPTVSCQKWEQYPWAFGQIREAMRLTAAPGFRGARILGIHAEGPYLSPLKHGAQNPADILPPDWARFAPLMDCVRLVTVAPEAESALALIYRLAGAGVTVSIGHTSATYAQAVAGIEAGATHATHLFNAMPEMLHREPGAAGALLTDGRVYCELIADGFHVHPALLTLAARLKGDKLVLITDSIRFTGLPDGEYTLGGQSATVRGVECRLADGTIAGSTLTLDRAVQNGVALGGMTPAQALAAASVYAAASIGETKRGALRPGMEADIVVFNAELCPVRTFVGGAEVWRA